MRLYFLNLAWVVAVMLVSEKTLTWATDMPFGFPSWEVGAFFLLSALVAAFCFAQSFRSTDPP